MSWLAAWDTSTGKKAALRVYLWGRVRFVSRMVRRGAAIGVQQCPKRPVSFARCRWCRRSRPDGSGATLPV